jgi:tetratricopeptide (TPR) repeat protein
LFCTECGTRNTADSKYCKECGGKVNIGHRTMMLSVDDLAAVHDAQNQERLKKLLDMAFWHNQAGNLDASVLASEAALAIHPNSTTAHSLLGTLYEKKGNDAKAIEHFEAVVTLNPNSAADAAKLDQVRRGVHAKAVAPPLAYKWLPPVLVGLNWEKSKEGQSSARSHKISWPAWPEKLPKPSPLIASCVAGVLVFGVCLFLLRPMAKATSPRTAISAPAVPVTAVANSAFGGASSNGSRQNSLPVPIVLKGVAANVPLNPPVAAAVNPDPFGETLAPGTPVMPLVRPSHPAHPARVASASLPKTKHSSAPALPPLSLRAVPLTVDGSSLAPAPITLPPSASSASMPQHTVVVSNLGSAPSPQTAALTMGEGSAPNALASHIKITINSSPSSVSISDHAEPASPQNANSPNSDGDAFQQSAISLQQQGDYHRAQTAYQKAIRAYKAQIASGRDTDAATQGLAASQTGLQICEQSQQ